MTLNGRNGTRAEITRAVQSQGETRYAAVNFDAYRILHRHRAVSLPHHGFLVYAYISDRSNAEITHSTLIFMAVTQITTIAENHSTRP